MAKPKRLLLFGDGPSQALLGKPLSQARGHVHKVEGVRTVATFHPRHLINRPLDKSLAWKDLAAADGGRSLKAGLLAFGALIWAAPVVAQAQDPLAPLPESSATLPNGTQAGIAVRRLSRRPSSFRPRVERQSTSAAGPPSTQRPCIAPALQPAIAAPKDWRGVFDAIDAGNWASAQAGIATLPPSVLTPVAKAELYTAKGSPVVDLASLQALIAQAPELPAGGSARD